MEKIILKYSDETTEEILNTDRKISFINIVTKLTDQLLIENHFAQSGQILRQYMSAKKLIGIDIFVKNEDGKEDMLTFDNEVSDVNYYYEYDSIRNRMREYLKIDFVFAGV